MATSGLKNKLQEGQTTLGAWCTLTDSFAAEVVGILEVDYVVIDIQLGVASYSDLIAILQGIETGGATPLLRIPIGDFGQKRDNIAGVHAFSGRAARRATERGFSMVTVGSDSTWLRAGYSRELGIARGQNPVDVVGFY